MNSKGRATKKDRLLILVAVTCFSLTALLVWHNGQEPPMHRPMLSEQAAKERGFSSSLDADRAASERDRYLVHEYKKGSLDAHDMEYVKSSLASGSPSAKMSVILNLGALPDSRQQQEIIAFMADKPIHPEELELWKFTITQWSFVPKFQSTMNSLRLSRNSELATLTLKVIDEQSKAKRK